jgi:hypothetical protein
MPALGLMQALLRVSCSPKASCSLQILVCQTSSRVQCKVQAARRLEAEEQAAKIHANMHREVGVGAADLIAPALHRKLHDTEVCLRNIVKQLEAYRMQLHSKNHLPQLLT